MNEEKKERTFRHEEKENWTELGITAINNVHRETQETLLYE